MLKMREFKLDLTSTKLSPEELQRKQEACEPFELVISMPLHAVVRRVNTRILQEMRTGINPQTREMGKFIASEECVYLWAECDEGDKDIETRFFIVPTNYKIPSQTQYVGTFLLQAGQHVFHVYRDETAVIALEA